MAAPVTITFLGGLGQMAMGSIEYLGAFVAGFAPVGIAASATGIVTVNTRSAMSANG